MKKFIKTNRKMIIISISSSIFISYLLGFTRNYQTFGGEDLIPVITLFYWIFKYIDKKENENDSTFW